MTPDREQVRAMLQQAVAEAQARGGRRITCLHLELYDRSPGVGQALCCLVAELSAGSLAEGAQVATRLAPSRFICWNCCGLRYESQVDEAVCPNCGDVGMLIPPDVTFALERVKVSDE